MAKGRWRLRIRGDGSAPILPLAISGTPTPQVTQNTVYPTFTPTVTGGVLPYVFSLTGTLQAGLSFSTVTGAISGTPTASGVASNLNITVTDAVMTARSLGVFSITSNAVAPPSNITVPIYTTDQQFVDITAWLDTVYDNNITVTVSGAVGMRVWGYESLQTNGQTRTWVDRKLREQLTAVTSAAAVADGTWTFSAKNGPNETGTTSTYVVTLAVQSTPVATTVASIYSLTGATIFPLQRFGSATDWTLDSQSTANLFALWDGTTANSARIGLKSATSTYLSATRQVTPTVGAHTATVSSVSLGISGRVITVTFRNDYQGDVGPCPARDSATVAPYHQLGHMVANGNSAGALVWGNGDILCREGVFNPTFVNQGWTVLQPTGTSPDSPFGTNSVESWDYVDGWNPAWIGIRGILPPIYTGTDNAPICQTQIGSARINVASLTSQTLGFRFTNLDLCKGSNTSSASLFIRDDSSASNGVHKVAIDHCTRANIVLNFEGDYSDMQIVAYNDIDNDAADFTASSFGIVGKDSQIIGNIFRHYIGDILNGFTYNSTVGSGRTKTSWNISVDKLLELGAHSDFYQTTAVLALQYKSAVTTPAGTEVDVGEFVGNWSTKGKGYKFTASDVGYIGLFFTAETVTAPGFAVGGTISNDAGTKIATVISVESARELRVQLPSGVAAYTNGEFITCTSGPGAGTTAVTNFNLAFNITSGPGFVVNDVLSNAGGTKTAKVVALNSPATSVDLQLLTGTQFSNGEAVTASISGTTGTRTSATSASASTTWPGGMVATSDIGKTAPDCQGFYNGGPQTPLTSTEHFRGDIPHRIFFAGWITEGLDSYGIMRLPPPVDSANYVVVNNLVTPPWGTISEVGTGGYYDDGRFVPGSGTIFPVQSTISSTTTIGSKIIGRNVFMCGSGFSADTSGINDLIGSDFGSPDNAVTSVPTQVTGAMIDPTGTATRTCVSDIEEDFSPSPGSILTTQGTSVDFGPIVDEIDYQRHTYDRAALATLA